MAVNDNSPALGAFDITPNDGQDLARQAILTCTGAGTVKVTTFKNDEVTIYLNAGDRFPLFVKRVHATGTTATGIVGLHY